MGYERKKAFKLLAVGNSFTQDALCEDFWDYILTQQASHDSGRKETYFPYLTYLL